MISFLLQYKYNFVCNLTLLHITEGTKVGHEKNYVQILNAQRQTRAMKPKYAMFMTICTQFTEQDYMYIYVIYKLTPRCTKTNHCKSPKQFSNTYRHQPVFSLAGTDDPLVVVLLVLSASFFTLCLNLSPLVLQQAVNMM